MDSPKRAKEFRRPFKINKHPESASSLECQGAIELGLSGTVKGRELKDQVNIVNNWVQNSDASALGRDALGQGVKQELTRLFEAVHERWRTFQYIRFSSRFASKCSNEFQTATQEFLDYARINLPSDGALGIKPLNLERDVETKKDSANEHLISETIVSPNEQKEATTPTAITSSELMPLTSEQKSEEEAEPFVDPKPDTSQGTSGDLGIKPLDLERDVETKKDSANEHLITSTSETIVSPNEQKEPTTPTAIESSELKLPTSEQESKAEPDTSQEASDALRNLEQNPETKGVSAELDQLKAIITEIGNEIRSGMEARHPSAIRPSIEHQEMMRVLDNRYASESGVIAKEIHYTSESYCDMDDENLEQKRKIAVQGLEAMQKLLYNYQRLEWAQDPEQLKTRTEFWKVEQVEDLKQQVKQLEELKNEQQASEQQASSVGDKMLIQKKITEYANILKNVNIEQEIRKFTGDRDRNNARNWRLFEYYKERADIRLEQAQEVKSCLLEIEDKAAKDIRLKGNFDSVGTECVTTIEQLKKIINYLDRYLHGYD
jgi:hypothetical protein